MSMYSRAIESEGDCQLGQYVNCVSGSVVLVIDDSVLCQCWRVSNGKVRKVKVKVEA